MTTHTIYGRGTMRLNGPADRCKPLHLMDCNTCARRDPTATECLGSVDYRTDSGTFMAVCPEKLCDGSHAAQSERYSHLVTAPSLWGCAPVQQQSAGSL